MGVPMLWWWISFASKHGFHGLAVVGPCPDFEAALVLAKSRECMPMLEHDIEAVGDAVPPEALPHIPDGFRHKLLSESEAIDLDMTVDLAMGMPVA